MPYPHVIRLRGPWEYEVLSGAPASAQSSASGTESSSRDRAPSGRVQLPCDWSGHLGDSFRGRVRYRRRFNRPSGLEPHERVWLSIDGVDACGRWSINGQPLGPIAGYALPAAADVTELLQSGNVLDVEIELPEEADSHAAARSDARGENLGPTSATPTRPGREHLAGGPIGEVRLEVRTTWHVDDLALYWTAGAAPQLRVRGRVLGPHGADPAALVIVGHQREVLCQDVPPGGVFDCASIIDDWPTWPDPDAEPLLTTVELRLVAAGRRVWQTMLETAPPSAAGDHWPRYITQCLAGQSPQRAVPRSRRWGVAALAEGAADVVRLDYLSLDSTDWQAALARIAGASLVVSRAVQPGDFYAALDQANVPLLQQVPAAWAVRVCARLAHHPSIVAWGIAASEAPGSATPGDVLDDAALEWPTFGRSWIVVP